MRKRLRRVVRVTTAAVTVGVGLWAFSYFWHTPRAFAGAARQANEVRLYEGLPHQMFERDLLAAERRTKAVVELDGYPFYQEPLTLAPQDAESLFARLGNPAAYRAWLGPKLCGGFHPDYAVEWHVGGSRYRALICLGCGEFKLSGPWPGWRYNMDAATTHEELRALFKSYQNRRPKGWSR